MKNLAVWSVLFTLTGCATLSEGQCRLGDWQAVGREDGRQGRAETYLAEHYEACSKYGVAVDKEAYRQGRQQGLQTYCTPEQAYELGRAGSRLARVCPVDQERALLLENEAGLFIHARRQELASVETEINTLEKKLADPQTTDEERKKIREQIRSKDAEVRRLRERLQDAEGRRR
jgi:hypothetical protein